MTPPRVSRRILASAVASLLLAAAGATRAEDGSSAALAEAWLLAGEPAQALEVARAGLFGEGASWLTRLAWVEAGVQAGHAWALPAEARWLAARDPALQPLAAWVDLRLEQGSTTAALARLRELSVGGDEHASLLYAAGLLRAGRPVEALEPAREVRSVAGRRLLVEALAASGRIPEAAAAARAALEVQPRHPEVALPLFAAGVEEGRVVRRARREAVATAETLLSSAEPADLVAAWQVLAWARDREGAGRAAETLARQVPGLALPPRLPYGPAMLRSLGEGLAQTGQERAAGALTAREEAAVATHRARSLRNLGQRDLAREALASAAAVSGDPALLLEAAEAWLDADPARARAWLARAYGAVARDPGIAPASQRELLARALAIEAHLDDVEGRPEDGLPLRLQAALLVPGGDSLLALAEAQEAAGARERALESFALAAAAGSESAALRLEALYRGPATADALIAGVHPSGTEVGARLGGPRHAVAAHLALPLRTPDGTMRLEALRGQVVVLVFWASWCEPCREELPLVADLAARWSGEGLPVRVLAVSADEDQAGWRRGLERFGALGMDLAWSAELAAALGVRALPAARVLDREGRVAGSLQGYDPGQASRLDTLVREQLEP